MNVEFLEPAQAEFTEADRDFARVGLLMSRNGRWKDRRIVSEEWVAESTKSYSDTDIPQTGYGYMWWVDSSHKSFSARGFRGQVMIVSPGHDLIIVHLVNTKDDPNRKVSGDQFSELLQRIMNAKLTGQ